MPAAKGWYKDPRGAGQRWWDGSSWTDLTRERRPYLAAAYTIAGLTLLGLAAITWNLALDNFAAETLLGGSRLRADLIFIAAIILGGSAFSFAKSAVRELRRKSSP